MSNILNLYLMKRIHLTSSLALLGCLFLSLLLLSGCAPKEVVSSCVHGQPYGFWGGLWHGFIAPFDLIGMILWNDVAVYAQNNNGVFYALGFILGSGGWGFFGGRGSRRRK
jgi:hypothetical protein